MKNKKLLLYSFRSLHFLWKRSKAYILLTFLEILTGVTGIFPGIYLTGLTTEMLTQKLPFRQYIVTLLFLITVLFLVQFVYQLVCTLSSQVQQKMYSNIQLEMDAICLRTDYEILQSKQFQEDKNFAYAALQENCLDLFMHSVKKLISSVLILAGVLSILAETSIWILLPMAVSLLIGFYYDYLNAHQNFTEIKEQTEYRRKSEYLHSISRDFSFAKEIRLFHLKDRFRVRMDEVDDLLFRLYEARRKQKQPSAGLYYLSDTLMTAAVYLYLGFQVLVTKTLSPGRFITCHQAIRQLKTALEDIIYVLTNFVVHTEYLKSFLAFMAKNLPEFSSCEVSRCPKAQIRFEHVSFRYPSAKEDTLHDINITIENGEKLLIVGENGAGKSTFIKLLCGFYKPTCGTIYLNETDISTIEPKQYMRQLSAVFQDYRLFAFSIEENISALHNEHLSAVPDALKQVRLLELVKNTFHGLKTSLYRMFDENGVEFSGGEMQRLAIARAFLKDSPVLILDEPTSALDPKAEYEISKSFQTISSNRTTILISHRLTSASFSDKIAVFDKGRIVEYGTHKELLDQNGIYADFYSMQASLYQEEVSYE